MKEDTYFTIKNPTQGEYKEKGSKFLAFAYNVNSEEEVKQRLEELRKVFYDARHHCYAYIIGKNEHERWRANDDGEPNHSAGTSILNQIKSFNLTNTLVVVVRYFGGTKLGVSGLITAYKTATQEALSIAEIEEKIITTTFQIEFDYLKTNDIMRLIKDFELDILHQEFTNTSHMTLAVRLNLEQHLEQELQEIVLVLKRL